MFRLRWSKPEPNGGFRSPGAIVAAYDEGVGALYNPARYVAGYSCGLEPLDNLAGGLRRGAVTVLGGAPGVGKMALALTYVRQAALVNGVATAIFSTAVTGEVLLLRLLAAETRTPLEQFTKQGLDVQQTAAVHQAWQKLNAAPLRINDSPELGATELRRSLVVLLRQAEVHLVVVISHTGHPVRHLTDVAREFHVALMLVCRSSGLTDDFADREQNSERILVLQRPGLANGAEVVVLRNRFGPTGRVKLTFNSDYMGFEDAHVRP